MKACASLNLPWGIGKQYPIWHLRQMMRPSTCWDEAVTCLEGQGAQCRRHWMASTAQSLSRHSCLLLKDYYQGLQTFQKHHLPHADVPTYLKKGIKSEFQRQMLKSIQTCCFECTERKDHDELSLSSFGHG
ncbi:hypothetical protein PoB_004053300 [Plakobranchus ocellatus]|uniref:Uncharacterized protein n=1 Tax=Plakobranchus ocellatus TaxID=259542 RepID=A0AAV4B4M1_9GAST|nr:hypothetical protein PoB_004053300 [Plakobranchus ocellatus]